MKDYHVIAKEGLVGLIEQAEEYRKASFWLKATDQPYWNHLVQSALCDLEREVITLDEAVWQVRNQIWEMDRERLVCSITPEDYESIMTMFGGGIIDTFQTLYGETFDVFEFEAFWDKFHGDNAPVMLKEVTDE